MKVHSSGSGFVKSGAYLTKLRSESFNGSGGRMQHPESKSHGRRDANGRRPANHHFANRFGDFAIIRVGVENLLGGQSSLVQHHDAAVGPFNGLRYVHSA